MARDKFVFDPKKLKYKQVNKNVKYRVLRIFGWIGSSLLLGIIIIFVYSFLFDTPKERQIRQENRALSQDLKRLDERYRNIDKVLGELSYIDENIYRTIFETDPVNISDSSLDTRLELAQLLAKDNITIVNVTTGTINDLMKGVKQYSMDYTQLQQEAVGLKSSLENIPAIQPIRNQDLTRLASGFGDRMHPFYKIVKFHSGMDFTAPTGTEVYATANGIIEDTDRTGRGHGNTIVINHENEYKTVYSHLDAFNVRKGAKVIRGDLIGWVGNTGFSVAPHLHYEVHLKGEPVNPVNYYFLELDPQEFNNMVELSIKSGQSFD